MIGGRGPKSRRLKVEPKDHKTKKMKMMLKTPNNMSEMILERSNTCRVLRQRVGHMMMTKRLLLKNRRNLNSVKIDRRDLKIDKILILRMTILAPRTSISTSISL